MLPRQRWTVRSCRRVFLAKVPIDVWRGGGGWGPDRDCLGAVGRGQRAEPNPGEQLVGPRMEKAAPADPRGDVVTGVVIEGHWPASADGAGALPGSYNT